MTKRCCANCVYSYCSLHMRVGGFTTGFGSRPLCSNHPAAPGQLREVSAGGICRNYRPKPPAPAQPQATVRRIPLAGGQFVLVDAADYEWLSRHTWSANGSGYVVRREKGKTVYMHRAIMQAPKGMVVDHIDGSRQNNCRSNLRICTQGENVQNNAKRRGSVSRFRGVGCKKDRGKWFARLKFNGERFWLGCFDDEVEAARAYDRLAVECFGVFARLNFPEEWPPERRQEAFAKKETIRAAQKAKAQRATRRKGKRKDEGQRSRRRRLGEIVGRLRGTDRDGHDGIHPGSGGA